jgi:hypothetical protein
MAQYQFVAFFTPCNDLRVDAVVTFLDQMRDAFGLACWLRDMKPVEISHASIERLLRSLADGEHPGAGASLVVAGNGKCAPLMAGVSTGADEWGTDYFDVDFSQWSNPPDPSHFRRVIEVTSPREAYILDNRNEAELRSRERARSHGRLERPTVVRWFHFLGAALAESVGGVAHCLQTPAYRNEPVKDGVLIQLTNEPFDTENPIHRALQLEAMRHLGLA